MEKIPFWDTKFKYIFGIILCHSLTPPTLIPSNVTLLPIQITN